METDFFGRKTIIAERIIGFVAFILGLHALCMIFLVTPFERVMGAVQKIFYFHVGSAIACYFAFGVVLIGALGYLATRKEIFDLFQEAAAEVAFIFCTVVLVTGMIWGYSAWNTPFRWEPRLVSFLLLWLISLALLLLRMFGDRQRIAIHTAVLGIIGAINVPIVVFSVKFLSNMEQLHPQVVENRGLKDPSFVKAMFISIAALVLFQFFLILIRARLGNTARIIERAR